MREPIETVYKEKIEDILNKLAGDVEVKKSDIDRNKIIENENYLNELINYIITDKLDNVPAFQQDVLAIIGKELLKMHIRADIKDRKYINNLITTEYLQQHDCAY